MIRRLRIKFICVNMAIVTCLLVLMFGMLFHSTRVSIERDQIDMMGRIAGEPARKGRPIANGDRGELNLPHFTLELGPDGEILCSGDSGFDLSDEEELRALYNELRARAEPSGILADRNLRYYRAETPHGARLVLADLSSERAALRHLLQQEILVGLLSFGVFLAASLFLSKWAVRPVDEAWRQQKQFVADASHELKTPLTVIMANAELLQQPGHDEQERRRFSESILAMSRQMRHLVESLLDLARLDSSQDPPPAEELDFSALCEECTLPFEPVFFEHGLLLETEIAPGIRVRGADRSLRQVVDILLDNARKYSLPGSVKMILEQAGHKCTLTVSNPSPALSREACRDVFRRFYRLDEARTASGSYGLGLPIAESIVTRHGGKIVCEYADGEARFIVSLPTV